MKRAPHSPPPPPLNQVCGAGEFAPQERTTECTKCPKAKYNSDSEREHAVLHDGEEDCVRCLEGSIPSTDASQW